MTQPNKNQNKPFQLDEDLSFDEALKRITERSKEDVERDVQIDEERNLERERLEEEKKKRQP